MFIDKPYYISPGHTSYRVRSDFWYESEENREFIRKRCCYTNGDTDWPRDRALSITVMSKDNPSGCIHFEGSEEFEARIRGFEPCPACDGTGLVNVAFDEPCDDCWGDGHWGEAA